MRSTQGTNNERKAREDTETNEGRIDLGKVLMIPKDSDKGWKPS